MEIYERIAALRKNKGITWTYLEGIINGHRGKFTDLKKGKTTLTSQEIFILSQALSTSPDYLMGLTDDPNPAAQKEKPPADSGELRDDIRELIRLYDNAPAEFQAAALSLLKSAEAARKVQDEA